MARRRATKVAETPKELTVAEHRAIVREKLESIEKLLQRLVELEEEDSVKKVRVMMT